MSFCYHMYGTDVKDLIVYVENSTTGVRNQVWKMSGSKGNRWLNATVSPGSVRGHFSVKISIQTGDACFIIVSCSLFLRVSAVRPTVEISPLTMSSSQVAVLAQVTDNFTLHFPCFWGFCC